jgi:hypothetical protein
MFAVLLVEPEGGSASRSSEAYADWIAYRDNFIEHESTGVVKLTLADYNAQVAEPRLANPFAALFIRDSFALLHDGMVLEPQIYSLGAKYLRQGLVDPNASEYGLHLVRFRLRQSPATRQRSP